MIIGIVLIAISVVFFVVFLRYLKNNIKIEVKETQVKNQLETAQKNYKELEENYNNIRRINHDLRNHIQTIMLFEQSASHEEIQKYIDEMKQEVQKWQ